MAEGLRVRLRQAAPIPLDAEFGCGPGELLALVGPSGSGKSTILRCIAGLVAPVEGTVECGTESWLDTGRGIALAPQQRRVGLVFQHYALFPHMSAEGNVGAALGHLQPAARAERARQLLARVHLDGLEDRRPDALSGGQQQRVALARALARDPTALLLDEPFSAVDQVTRRRLHEELAQLRRELKLPIVLVTHDLDEAAALADTLCIVHRGRTLQSGPPAEVMSRPDSALVARVVDLRNLFDATVVAHSPDLGLTRIRWGERLLEARHAPGFEPGERVSWAIPPADVILHRRDRPSRGERENPVDCEVRDLLMLGDTARVTLAVAPEGERWLELSVPVHVARRNGLGTGERVRVSLLADAIHLMRAEG